MSGIKTRGGKCGECKWFKPEPKLMRECAPYHFDGVCMNQKHTGGHRDLEYSRAGCCFDAEDPDEQLTFADIAEARSLLDPDALEMIRKNIKRRGCAS